MRKRLDLGPYEPLNFEVDGEQFSYPACHTFAEISDMPANIHNNVLRTPDGRFIRLTIIAEGDDHNPLGTSRGWYVARLINETEAARTRKSWAVLREQPSN